MRDQAFKAVAMLVQILEEHAAKMVCLVFYTRDESLLSVFSLKLLSKAMVLPLASAHRMVVPRPRWSAPPLVQQEPLQAGRYPRLGRRSTLSSHLRCPLFLTTPYSLRPQRCSQRSGRPKPHRLPFQTSQDLRIAVKHRPRPSQAGANRRECSLTLTKQHQ